jgi:hypothetical protein
MAPRRVSLAILSILLLAALSLGVPSSRAEESILANDQCVARKLDSAASHCEKVLRAWARWDLHRHRHVRRGQIQSSADWMRRAWKRANKFAAQDGASCRATTGGSGEVSKVIRRGAKEIAKTINRGLDLTTNPRKTCASRYLKAAAEACEELLEAESDHLLERFDDRLREELAEDREDALNDFAKAWGKIDKKKCSTDADPDEVEDLLEDLVSEVVRTASVSPGVSTEWEMIVPDDLVEYRGKSLEPTCSDGSPWVFFARRGSVNKLIVNYQGGGACWNGFTCIGVEDLGFPIGPTFKQTTGASDNPAGWSSGFADYSNPNNPFRDWNAIFIPYCTGDVHWGDAVVEHERATVPPKVRTIHHKGFVNAQVAEKWAREHFAHPEQVFVTGSSAGAYGAIMNSLFLQEFAYPSARFAVLGDAGNGVITDDFLENHISKWGLEANLPEWIPGLNVPLTELNASDLYVEAAATYPQNRFATYTAAYDGGDGGQVGFYHVMKSGDNILAWPNWWESSCEWNGIMREQNFSTAAGADNFRYYIGSGAAHTMFGRDKVYTDTTGNVPTIVDWIGDMLSGSDDDWQSVECDDCSTLLPGDPGPSSLPTPPYTDDGRLVCEE